jgi:hypothetical protein
MLSTSKVILGAMMLGSLARGAGAETIDPIDVFLSGRVKVFTGNPYADAGEGFAAPSGGLDYAGFVHELVAFTAKEVLHDDDDEIPAASSGIPSRLSAEMPEQTSDFGSHCMVVLRQIGTQVSVLPGTRQLASTGRALPTVAAYAVRTATTALALRQIWFAFRNQVEDGRQGVSLKPKVSAQTLGVSLTFRW